MCRIVGFWDFNKLAGYPLEKTICAMRDTLQHGGPDDAGCYVEEASGIAFGHRRLSIIDLSAQGHQPMWDEQHRYLIVLNGEVYNFKQVKQELIDLGHKFSSNSDTEVALQAYLAWGLDGVSKLRGMFAYAIWDSLEKKLVLCRDRLGVKPLYWYFKDGLFMFASELKALYAHPKFVKDLDKEALSLFLQYGYISAPFTIFKHTHKLEQGNFLIINAGQEIRKQEYWEPEKYFLKGLEERKDWLRKSEEQVLAELEALLLDSAQLRMVADVDVGVFLSGGVDSSLVTALLQKNKAKPLQTFTIGFEEKKYNEAGFAKKIAQHLGTNHTEAFCSAKDALEIIPKLPEIYDEPFGDPSAIPTYLVSKLARKSVKVALSADGGDEQFWGYTGYKLLEKLIRYGQVPFAKQVLLNPISKFLIKQGGAYNQKWQNYEDKFGKLQFFYAAEKVLDKFDCINKYFSRQELVALGIKAYGSNTRLVNAEIGHISGAMLQDIKAYLPDDILVKVDRASMAVALEAREPLLDHKLLEYTLQMPYELKNKHGISKYFLKQILYKYVPKEFVDRPKQGFGIPMYEWFREDLSDLYKEYLSEERLRKQGIFEVQEVQKLLQRFLNNQGVQPVKLWHLFVFQLWAEQWL